jgi:uncharacterized protein DUF4386
MPPMTFPIDNTQRKAARAVGFSYLFALVTGVFAEFYARGTLLVHDDAAQTAQNIVAHEGLFRLGIVANLTTFSADIVLITALYAVLRPVAPNLALAALFWRLLETASLGISALSDFDVLRLLSGAGYLEPLDAPRLHALARLSVSAHDDAYQLGLFFFGFGSTLFCCLWLKSGYVPRALALFGVFASALVGVCAYLFILFPRLAGIASPICYVPVFLFELTMGLWLSLRGVRGGSQPGTEAAG